MAATDGLCCSSGVEINEAGGANVKNNTLTCLRNQLARRKKLDPDAYIGVREGKIFWRKEKVTLNVSQASGLMHLPSLPS